MRVSDRTIARNYLSYLFQAKENYAKTNERIHSGHRFEKVSEDVSAANRVLNIRMDKYKTEKQLDNIASINDKLSMVESTMRSIHDMNVRVYEQLVVQAKNTPTGDTGRAAIADEIKAMREEIVQFTNTTYGGKYLFSGTNAGYAPFAVNKDGKMTYNGVDVDSILKRADNTLYYVDKNGNEQDIPLDEDIYLDIGLGITMQGSQVDPDSAYKISYSGLDVFGFGMTTSTTRVPAIAEKDIPQVDPYFEIDLGDLEVTNNNTADKAFNVNVGGVSLANGITVGADETMNAKQLAKALADKNETFEYKGATYSVSVNGSKLAFTYRNTGSPADKGDTVVTAAVESPTGVVAIEAEDLTTKGSQIHSTVRVTNPVVEVKAGEAPPFDSETDVEYSNNFYNVLTQIEDAIRKNDMDRLDKLNTHLRELNDKYFGNVTELGSKTSYLETLETRAQNTVDNYDKRINNLMGTNYEEESTNQTMNDYVLKAILQMGANLLPVSLMDFLN